MKERERSNNKSGLTKNGEVYVISTRVIELMDFSDPEFVRIVFANKREVFVKSGTEIRFRNNNIKIRNINL